MNDEKKTTDDAATKAEQSTDLSEAALDRVVGGDNSAAATKQMVSNVLKMLADTNKAIIQNIR